MDTKKLRQKILDLAIRGKLVPQDPNDEPASVLIEKIRLEKEQLIKEKKIKRDKNESYIYRSDKSYYEQFSDGTVKCIDEEIPFEIPESWEWCRWRNLFQINPKNNIEDNAEVSFVPMTYIKDGYSDEAKFDIRQWKDIKSGFTHFQNNDLGIAKITPCFENRKSVVFKNLHNVYGAGTTELHIFRPVLFSVLADYALYIAKTEDFISHGITNFTGAVGQQRVGKDIIGDYLIALPPLEEIYKIQSSISKLFLIVDGIENDETQLSSYIKQTKSKILDLAIRGKLVPQDPDDEPASVLLERIKAERSDSKKKTKNTGDNSHYTDTFDIPNNWVVTTMQEVCYLSDGEKIEGKALPYLDVKYLRGKSEPKIVSSGRFVERNNFMILVDGENSGEIFSVTEDGYQGSTFKILNISKQVNEAFIFKLLQNEQTTFKESKVGSAIPHLNKKLFRELYVFLPPFAEQKRIVRKIEEIFASLEEIVNSIIA
ncbi:MAG: hypothetical protein BGO09_12565 [Bacteroidetes bacterium 47-18]|nr:MAG: hypothetical protein BGO09_12565 [Bacteroidetes bacterium 47-18]